MIRTFRSKSLADLWAKGSCRGIDVRLHKRILRRLEALDNVTSAEGMNVPGYDFHGLRGFKPARYTVHVNGPWCVTFEFEEGDVCRVDLEQYH